MKGRVLKYHVFKLLLCDARYVTVTGDTTVEKETGWPSAFMMGTE
jgi:hypothetical protein